MDESGAVCVGVRGIGGLNQATAERIAAVDRKKWPFSSVADLAARASLQRRDLDLLAAADALSSLAGHRRQAAWAASVEKAAGVVQGDLFDGRSFVQEAPGNLPAPGEGENLVADYRSLGLSLRAHPLTLLRKHLAERRFVSAADFKTSANPALIRAPIIVVGRQRPAEERELVEQAEVADSHVDAGVVEVPIHGQGPGLHGADGFAVDGE